MRMKSDLNEPTFAEFRMRLGAGHDFVGSVFTRRTARCQVVGQRRCRAFISGNTRRRQQQQQQQQQCQWTNNRRHDWCRRYITTLYTDDLITRVDHTTPSTNDERLLHEFLTIVDILLRSSFHPLIFSAVDRPSVFFSIHLKTSYRIVSYRFATDFARATVTSAAQRCDQCHQRLQHNIYACTRGLQKN